jgi:starch synthase
MVRAWEGFRFKADWRKLQQRGMTTDFSWYRSAGEYLKIYKQLIGEAGELSAEEQAQIETFIAADTSKLSPPSESFLATKS